MIVEWLAFANLFHRLDGYFNGVKTIVNKAHHIPEYPSDSERAPLPPPVHGNDIPKPTPYSPYDETKDINTCYLDANETIPAPNIYAYTGVPQDMPDPVLGSYELLGIRDDVCFDRFGRYGPYGLGYSKVNGGSGSGIDTEGEGSEEVWAKTGKIDYSKIDWGDAQERCYNANKHRFQEVDDETGELQRVEGKKGRVAVIIRSYTGFRWTEHAVLNFRALINELALRSGGEYHVHFLMQVRDVTAPIFSDDQTAQRIIDENVPEEFRSLVTLWTEPQMKLFYPGAFPDALVNPSGQDIHGIYRSAHFPLQVFALQHPEYEHFWNWEMDMRYLGSYYEFFDRLGKWSADQPRPFMWERSARYYIPSYHGSWENFTKTVQKDTLNSGRPAIFGPQDFEGKGQLQYEFEGKSVMPESCSMTSGGSKCGVGEDADLITLNPLFDTDESGWYFAYDVTGYTMSTPRRCAIITAGRLSRRLLMAMHEEVWRNHHTMFSEMFPPSVALHHGFKALYAPHPIYLERAWYPYSDIDAAFNGGRDHSTSGQGSPFDLRNEHNHKGTSWYYHSEWAGMLWRRWLGYAQRDGRGKNGGRAGTGTERGGKLEEMGEKSSGRMCLRGMLVHPIKFEHPSESSAYQ